MPMTATRNLHRKRKFQRIAAGVLLAGLCPRIMLRFPRIAALYLKRRFILHMAPGHVKRARPGAIIIRDRWRRGRVILVERFQDLTDWRKEVCT